MNRQRLNASRDVDLVIKTQSDSTSCTYLKLLVQILVLQRVASLCSNSVLVLDRRGGCRYGSGGAGDGSSGGSRAARGNLCWR
jgi:hypothetical protein